MPSEPYCSSFNESARRVESELRSWVANFNDQVVPSLRRDGGKALRVAAAKMAEWAEALEKSHQP